MSLNLTRTASYVSFELFFMDACIHVFLILITVKSIIFKSLDSMVNFIQWLKSNDNQKCSLLGYKETQKVPDIWRNMGIYWYLCTLLAKVMGGP